MHSTTIISQPLNNQKRRLPSNFRLDSWIKLEPYYRELANRRIRSLIELEEWILDRSQVDAVVFEEFGWRYIRMTVDMSNESAIKKYNEFVKDIRSKVMTCEQKLDEKLLNNPFIHQLSRKRFSVYVRGIQKKSLLFQEDNLVLLSQESLLARKYGELLANISVEIEGRQLTIQQTNALLESPDRELRARAYQATIKTMQQQKMVFDTLFDQLLEVRNAIADNANHPNYVSYIFEQLGRFDYTPLDCHIFHKSVEQKVLPILDEINQRRKDRLGIDQLRPWDLQAESSTGQAVVLTTNVDDLIETAQKVLQAVHPFFADCLATMQAVQHLDLEIRPSKRPGGYNMPLGVTGIPFIFMNVAGSKTDVRTLMHETGHAVHSFLMKDLELSTAQRPPAEIAELAAMTMELLTLDHWGHFFEAQETFSQVKIWMLENILQLLPWIATIDKFQHWLYANPQHTTAERKAAWLEIYYSLSPSTIHNQDLQDLYAYYWHRQLHLFEAPFYYIEYGIAQLGAIAIWKNYKENGEQAISQFMEALKLGYTQTIPEVYQTAGIAFDFSESYIQELVNFVYEQLQELYHSRTSGNH